MVTFYDLLLWCVERHELLVQSTQSKDKEASQLRERLSSINETATRQDIKIEELANSLLQARQSMETVTAENQQYKIERQIWKSSEARVLKESQDLVKERNAANDRIRELQDTLDESDRKSGMKIKRMEDQVEEVNRDLQLSRKQLADVIDDHRTLTAKRDAELREFQIKMERMVLFLFFFFTFFYRQLILSVPRVNLHWPLTRSKMQP